MKLSLVVLAAVALLLQSGCVTEQRTYALTIPSGQLPAPTKGSVYIAGVTDDREFQEHASDPSVPSADPTAPVPASNDRLIGRQRNGLGQAKGDITLPDNDSVARRARLLVEEGLRRAGYSVTSEPEGAMPVTISVEKFWAWMSPGLGLLNFEAKIACRVMVKTNAGNFTFVVWGFGKTHGAVSRAANWQEAYEPAFQEFFLNLKREMARVSR